MLDVSNQNLLLLDDIARIKKEHDVSRNTASYSGILHLEGEDIDISKFFITTEVMSNFNKSITDSIIIEFLIEDGTYYKKILKEKETLFCTLTKRNGTLAKNETFKFLILNDTIAETGRSSDYMSEDNLNKNGMRRVKGQCINTTYYATRLINKPCNFRGLNVEKALISFIGDFINNNRDIKVNGTPLSIDKLNIDTPDNLNFYNNITLNSSVTILDLPTSLQEEYGVYNGFLGTYVRKEYLLGDEKNLKDSIYIYPLYNPGLIKNRKKKIRFYAEKGLTGRMIETTFKNNVNSLDILCSSETLNKQTFNQYSSDNGAGFQMADANYITRENHMENPRDELFLNQAYEKQDGVPFTRHFGISSNPFKQRSLVMLKSGTTISINWNFSIPELVQPGMAAEYIFEITENGKPKLKVLYGTVQSIYSVTDNNRKSCNSIITLFLEGVNLNG